MRELARIPVPVQKAGVRSKQRFLLIGMVYSKLELGSALRRGQLERDGRRCLAIEQQAQGSCVFTLDTNHECDDDYVKPDRHYQGNISDYRRIRTSFLKGGRHAAFDQIIVDYIHMPPCYMDCVLSEKFFKTTLTGLVNDNMLRVTGEIWIPNIGRCGEYLEQYASSLKQYYQVELVTNPMLNPLYAATDDITDDLVELADMCTNNNGTGDLAGASGGPFYRLVRTK
jgi:hypothetical protein